MIVNIHEPGLVADASAAAVRNATNIPRQPPAALPLPDPACGQPAAGVPVGNAGRGIRLVAASF